MSEERSPNHNMTPSGPSNKSLRNDAQSCETTILNVPFCGILVEPPILVAQARYFHSRMASVCNVILKPAKPISTIKPALLPHTTAVTGVKAPLFHILNILLVPHVHVSWRPVARHEVNTFPTVFVSLCFSNPKLCGVLPDKSGKMARAALRTVQAKSV